MKAAAQLDVRAAAVFIVGLLSACAPQQWAPGPGTSVADFEPAKARCSLLARHSGGSFAAYGNANFVAGAALGNAIGESIRTQQDFSDCMRASGWQPVTPAAVAAHQTKLDQIKEVFGRQKQCVAQVRSNPKYVSLNPHLIDSQTGQYSMMQLADQTIPSPAEAQLAASYWDEAKLCYLATNAELQTNEPEIAQVLRRAQTQNERAILLLVERKISWGDADRLQKETLDSLMEQLRAIRI